MKERKIYLDLIRVVACVMVVLMHSPVPESLNPATKGAGPFLVYLSYLTTPCVPLFFMVSGALLLPCKSEINAIDYLKKRLKKVVFPTLSFTLLYVIWTWNPTSGVKDAIVTLLSIPFKVKGHGVLWFMYTLTGLYLLIPILSHWIRNVSKRELELYLCIWGISLMYPFIGLFLDIETEARGILYYFTGYVGYFLLGNYLAKYEVSFKILLIFAIMMLPLPLVNKILNWNLDFYSVFWYLSITVAVMTATWFVAIKKYWGHKNKIEGICGKFIETTSNYGFGIYLVHIFIMRAFIWYIPFVENISNYYLQTIVVAILTFTASWIFSWLIAKLPCSQYIIGYSSKK